MGFLGFMWRQLFSVPKPSPPSTNLRGRTIIITGSNSGIGLETAKELLSHEPQRIILGVRSLSKGEAARAELEQTKAGKQGKCDIQAWELNQDSVESILSFCELARGLDRVDAVVLNAGIFPVKYALSPTAHESTVQVNHLGTALLSLLLLPCLEKAPSRATADLPHLTITTSEVHMWTSWKERKADNILEEMDKESTFGVPGRYYDSKLLNVLWTRELASRIRPAANVLVNMVNPGLCSSGLHRDNDDPSLRLFKKVSAWTTAQGGHCIVDAVLAHGMEEQGGYFSEQKLTP